MDTNKEITKPQTVKIAVVLLWLSVTLSFVAIIIQYRTIQTLVPNSNAIIVSFVITFFFSILLIIKIAAGRNWARIIYVVLTAISTATFLYSYLILDDSEYTNIQIVQGFMNNSLDIFISFLLLGKSASPWFANRNAIKIQDSIDKNKHHIPNDVAKDSNPIDYDLVYNARSRYAERGEHNT
jgi:hypothetical protein